MSRFTDALDAWHGSHADFDEFRDDKINTGEGAQVYGHGHYVGEAKGTGETYRDSVARKRGQAKGYYFDRDDAYGPIHLDRLLSQSHQYGAVSKPVDRMLLQVMGHNNLPSLMPAEQRSLMQILHQANDQYHDNGPTPESLLEHHQAMHEDVLEGQEFDPSDEEHVESKAFLDSYPRLKKWIDAVKEAVGGRLYELKLDLSEPHILDWEEQLQNQHPEVLDKLKAASSMDVAADNFKNMSAGDFYKSILSGVNGHGSPQAASKALLDAGIHGIRYLDQFSRGRLKPELWIDDKKVYNGGGGVPKDNDFEVHHLSPDDFWAVKEIASRSQYHGIDDVDKLRQHYQDYLVENYDNHNDPRPGDSNYAVRALKWLHENGHRLEMKPAQPTYNYVVLDPKLIRIVRKYDDRGNIVHDYTQAAGTELRPVDHDPFAEEKK